MADGYIQAAPDSTGKKVDTSEITVGGVLVERQRFVLGDNTAPEQFAAVKAASTAPVSTDMALVVALSPNGPLPAGTNVVGTVMIGATAGSGALKVGQRLTTAWTMWQAGSAAPHTLLGLVITNTSAAVAYVDLFDSTTASAGSATGLWVEVLVPAGQTLPVPLPPQGVAFTTGIQLFIATATLGTTGVAGVSVGVVYA